MKGFHGVEVSHCVVEPLIVSWASSLALSSSVLHACLCVHHTLILLLGCSRCTGTAGQEGQNGS